MKKILIKLIRPFVGKKYQQPFYEKLHLLSLIGMNYGIGGDLSVSGELKTLSYIKEKIKDNSNIILFDIGANTGEYTKALLKVFNKQNTTIYSFEPSKQTFNTLSKNLNNSNANLINLGMSSAPGKVILYFDNKYSGLASVYKRNLEHISISLDSSEEIELTTIDIFCAKNNIDTIHFMKLDVEGHEYKVLEGAKNMLHENKIKFIQFEFGGCNLDSKTYFKDFFDLLKYKYKLYRILGNGLREIKVYNEIQLEIFTTINFLAELKNLN